MSRKHLPTCIWLAATALLLSQCAPLTPIDRIAKNPALYTAQPQQHQQLIEHGELARGMSREAVVLAWGEPKQTWEGVEKDRTIERWDYFGRQAVYRNHFSFGYGYNSGWGRRGPYSALSLGPEVQYVPFRKATVSFRNNKVESWERMQPQQ